MNGSGFTAEEFLTKSDFGRQGCWPGLRKGEAINILARNPVEWTCLDAAITSIGGVVVPIYDGFAGPDQIYRE